MIDNSTAASILSEMVQTSRTFRIGGQRSRSEGLTGTKFGFLQHLRHRDARLGELAHQLLVSAPVASRAVEALEVDGLVERRPDPSDARAVLISITDRGLSMISESESRAIERFASALDDWSHADAQHAIQVLKRLNLHLGEITRANDSADILRTDHTTAIDDRSGFDV